MRGTYPCLPPDLPLGGVATRHCCRNFISTVPPLEKAAIPIMLQIHIIPREGTGLNPLDVTALKGFFPNQVCIFRGRQINGRMKNSGS